MGSGGRKKQRAHKPAQLGPRVYRKGRHYQADLRPWDGGRIAIRNPNDPGWPWSGERTEDEDIARKWVWAHLEYVRDGIRRHQLGQPPRPRKLSAAYQAFEEHRRTTVSENTQGTDRTANLHLLTALGDRMTDRITTLD